MDLDPIYESYTVISDRRGMNLLENLDLGLCLSSMVGIVSSTVNKGLQMLAIL